MVNAVMVESKRHRRKAAIAKKMGWARIRGVRGDDKKKKILKFCS